MSGLLRRTLLGCHRGPELPHVDDRLGGWSSGRLAVSRASLWSSEDRIWSLVDMPQCDLPLTLVTGDGLLWKNVLAPARAVSLRQRAPLGVSGGPTLSTRGVWEWQSR
jgi:hypothetical protein